MDFVKVRALSLWRLILCIQTRDFWKDFSNNSNDPLSLAFLNQSLDWFKTVFIFLQERSSSTALFSGLSRSFALASMGIHRFCRLKPLSLSYLTLSLVSSLTRNFQMMSYFGLRWEVGITAVLLGVIFLPSLSQPWLANLGLPLILAVVGYHAISLSGNYPVSPKAIDWGGIKLIYLGYGHRLFLGFLVTCQTCHLAWLSTVFLSLEPVEAFQGSTGEFWGQCWTLVSLSMPSLFRHTSEEGEINATIWWMLIDLSSMVGQVIRKSVAAKTGFALSSG